MFKKLVISGLVVFASFALLMLYLPSSASTFEVPRLHWHVAYMYVIVGVAGIFTWKSVK